MARAKRADLAQDEPEDEQLDHATESDTLSGAIPEGEIALAQPQVACRSNSGMDAKGRMAERENPSKGWWWMRQTSSNRPPSSSKIYRPETETSKSVAETTKTQSRSGEAIEEERARKSRNEKPRGSFGNPMTLRCASKPQRRCGKAPGLLRRPWPGWRRTPGSTPIPRPSRLPHAQSNGLTRLVLA